MAGDTGVSDLRPAEWTDSVYWKNVVADAAAAGLPYLPRAWPETFENTEYKRNFTLLPLKLPILETLHNSATALREALERFMQSPVMVKACEECMTQPSELLPILYEDPPPAVDLFAFRREKLRTEAERRRKLLRVLGARQASIDAAYSTEHEAMLEELRQQEGLPQHEYVLPPHRGDATQKFTTHQFEEKETALSVQLPVSAPPDRHALNKQLLIAAKQKKVCLIVGPAKPGDVDTRSITVVYAPAACYSRPP